MSIRKGDVLIAGSGLNLTQIASGTWSGYETLIVCSSNFSNYKMLYILCDIGSDNEYFAQIITVGDFVSTTNAYNHVWSITDSTKDLNRYMNIHYYNANTIRIEGSGNARIREVWGIN